MNKHLSLIAFSALILMSFSSHLKSESLSKRIRVKGGSFVYFDIVLGPSGPAYFWRNAFDNSARVWTRNSDGVNHSIDVKPGAEEKVFWAFDNNRTANMEITVGNTMYRCQIYRSKVFNWQSDGWSADCQ